MKYRLVTMALAAVVATAWVSSASGGGPAVPRRASVVQAIQVVHVKPKKPKKKPKPPPQLNSPNVVSVTAGTPLITTTEWRLDVRGYPNLGGYIGLSFDKQQLDKAAVYLWYYSDKEMTVVTGIHGMPLASSIPSNAILIFPNEGDFVKIVIIPLGGAPRLEMRLFGTKRTSNLPLIPPDNMLYTEHDHPLAAHTPEPLTPDDYFAGEVVVHFKAPPGWTIYFWAADWTWVQYEVRENGPADFTVVVPFGAWWAVISNGTDQAGTYDLTVTPNWGQKVVIVPQKPAFLERLRSGL